MTLVSASTDLAVEDHAKSMAGAEHCWYAAYTRSNHENRVAQELERRSVEGFLPLYESVHRWKDRRVRVKLPLFPGYLFVRIALRNRLQVLGIPGVVRLVGFNGSPTPLPDNEVEILREGLARQLRAEPHPYLIVGKRVRIRSGPLTGAEGILVRKKTNFRVVLNIDCLLRSAAFEVDLADVVPIH